LVAEYSLHVSHEIRTIEGAESSNANAPEVVQAGPS